MATMTIRLTEEQLKRYHTCAKTVNPNAPSLKGWVLNELDKSAHKVLNPSISPRTYTDAFTNKDGFKDV